MLTILKTAGATGDREDQEIPCLYEDYMSFLVGYQCFPENVMADFQLSHQLRHLPVLKNGKSTGGMIKLSYIVLS